MFLSYLSILILLAISFHIVLMIVGIPVSLIISAFSRTERSRFWSAFINMIIINVIYSGFIGLITKEFTLQYIKTNSWAYGVSGFVFTVYMLFSNTYDKMKNNPDWDDSSGIGYGVITGAGIGSLVALFVYPIVYLYPDMLLSVDSVNIMVILVLAFGMWLNDYWFVRLFLIVAACAYIVNIGFISMMGIGIIFMSLLSKIKTMLNINKAA